ncbi:MAG: alpha-L-arabinofuranosidase C-terminal domain-containing protein [Ferruginibacter sp.]
MNRQVITSLLFLALSPALKAQAIKEAKAKITVEVNKPGHRIPSTLFGSFFEDINHSTDGGLYPELIRNRSFEDSDTLQNWKFINQTGTSKASVINVDAQYPPTGGLNVFNPKYLSIEAKGECKLENNGFFGMDIVKGSSYTFKLAARSGEGFSAPIKVSIVSAAGTELAGAEVKGFDEGWKYYTVNLTAAGSDAKAHIEIGVKGNGRLYMDMVSLMPDQTWNWKGHGLRADLAEALNAMQTKVFRFPGGCWVEGDHFKQMHNWKKTIGNIDTRTSSWNFWGYNATQGLGYHEYLQLAEDLGAEPLFCINAGMSHRDFVPMDQMGQWVQDAFDAIEYANGDESSVWGSIRAKNGHPKPFNMKYIEIGNENGGDPYAERWKLIANAIRSKYPGITLIANSWGAYPKDPMPDLVDEHYYDNPEWFILNTNKYDNYDRKAPKIFIGEYAVTSKTGKGNLRGAIGEAAWMTGLERNSDVVTMSAYAPLFCNVNHKAWPINLINFDSQRWYGLPGYYVQTLFAQNQGTVSLPVKVAGVPLLTFYDKGCLGFGTSSNSAEFKDLKVLAPDGRVLLQTDFTKNFDDWQKAAGEWTVKDGVLRQSATTTNTSVFFGDKSWTDYTVTFKGRKISGENGIQVYFRNQNKEDQLRWEIGCNKNTGFTLDNGFSKQIIPGSIEADRWYDIKVEVKGGAVKGYLDGKLIQEISTPGLKTSSICVSAAKDERSGDIILKVVNGAPGIVKTEINLSGAEKLTGKGKSVVLTSASPLDENTLEQPTKVSPKTENVKFSGTIITRSFPGNSLTILRLSTYGIRR